MELTVTNHALNQANAKKMANSLSTIANCVAVPGDASRWDMRAAAALLEKQDEEIVRLRVENDRIRRTIGWRVFDPFDNSYCSLNGGFGCAHQGNTFSRRKAWRLCREMRRVYPELVVARVLRKKRGV